QMLAQLSADARQLLDRSLCRRLQLRQLLSQLGDFLLPGEQSLALLSGKSGLVFQVLTTLANEPTVFAGLRQLPLRCLLTLGQLPGRAIQFVGPRLELLPKVR